MLTSDPASNSHLSEVLYLRTLKANIVFSSLYTVKFVGQTNDNIKPCWKQRREESGALFLCSLKKNQQKEGCRCRTKKEKLCAFCAVHLSVVFFIVTALKEEVEIHAS